MRNRYLVLVVGFSLVGAVGLAAQGVAPAGGGASKKVAFKDLYDANAAVGDAQGATLDDGSGVVVSVDDKTQTAAIQFVRPWLRGKLSLTVAAAVDKETGTAEFVGFDQPLGIQQAKIEYNYIRWPEFSLYALFEDATPGSFEGADLLDELLLRKVSACREAVTDLKRRLDQSLRYTLWSAEFEMLYREVEKADPPTRAEIEAYIGKTEAGGTPNLPTTEAEKKAEAKVQSLIQSLDQDKGVCAKLEVLMPRLYSVGVVARGELTDRRAAILFGANGTVGRKEFRFLDRDLLQSDGAVDTTSAAESPISVGVRLGWVFLTKELEGAPESSLIFSYNRERSFKAADDLTFCQPVEGLEDFSELEACKEIPGSAPASKSSDLFSAEFRKKFKNIGLAIRGFYRGNEDKADDFGIEIPVYFLTNKDSGFQGGVTFGWRDQDDDGSIAVFVGRKFDLGI